MADDIKPYSSYQSKFNAAESMLQIFEAVMDHRSEECLELLWCVQNWDDLFRGLIDCFNSDELRTLASQPYDRYYRGTWLGRLRKFVKEAQREGFVPGVHDVYTTIYDVVYEEEVSEEEELPEEDEGDEYGDEQAQ